MNTIPMPCSQICNDYYLIHAFKNGRNNSVRIYLTSIDDTEELKLDRHKEITITRNDKKFTISPEQVYCYGNVDFHKGSRDFTELSHFHLFPNLFYGGKIVYSNYNYENHTCESPNNYPLVYDTFNPAILLQYAHGYLRKPEKVVLFKIETYGH